MKAPLAFGILSFGVLVFACAPRNRGAEPTTAKGSTKSQREPRADKIDQTPRIESALVVNNTDGVRFDFKVTNAGAAKVEMNFPSGQTHEVVVLDTLGREVWRSSKGQIFTQLLQNKVLRTDDTLAYGERWTNAPRGQYVAVARLASSNYPIEQRTNFVVR